MSLPKIRPASALDIMKVDDGNDSLDTFIRQAIGKERFLPFSKANDNPVQWIQLLHALDHQAELPGWPLLSPLKVQMQKCDKCSREFCSTINYRRHMRLHRRNLNLDKDSTMKNRVLLQAFWDKLSLEEAMEIMSLNDVSLEGASGTSIVKALTSFIRKPGFTSLPQSYVKSGAALLDIVQGRPSRFPISSQELFGILDEASEKTFLYAGNAESLQKYVFDGEAGKIGLEMRNLIACTSFLVEQKLVKACLADKDAEALRYQKLLVEEEEAAQKRRDAILEKKRQKKLRQKEQRSKVQACVERCQSTTENPDDTFPSLTSSPCETDLVLEVPEFSHNSTQNVESYNNERHDNENSDLDTSQNVLNDLGSFKTFERQALHRVDRRNRVKSHWQAHTSHNYQTPKLGKTHKYASFRDSRAPKNGVKVWAPKPKSETDDESCKTRLKIEEVNLPSQDLKHEVLIGSISVTLGNCNNNEDFGIGQERSCLEFESRNRDCGVGKEYSNGNIESEKIIEVENSSSCLEEIHAFVESKVQGGAKFSSYMAEAFLAKRWKEAIASDHVKLVLHPERTFLEYPEVHG